MTSVSRTLSSIVVDDAPDWSSAPYLTIDFDWASDLVLADSIDLAEHYRVPTTWFVTHETPLLARLRDVPFFELGIHPNFNYLLNGDDRAGRDASEVIDRLLTIVPEAKSVRSHSTTQNSSILDLFVRRGLSHECNTFLPFHAGVALRPWSLWSGLTRVPYFWEDDVECLYGLGSRAVSIDHLFEVEGVKVFDFHPIHIFLNTEHMDRYENTRGLHQFPDELRSHRFEGDGIRSVFLKFLQLASPISTTK